MRRITLWIVLLLPVVAQAQYGYVTGIMLDRFGPLANASVSIKNTSYGTFTDENGYYAFEIDTGYYEISVELTGYQPIVEAIQLKDLEQKELDFEMESALMDADVGLGSKSKATSNQLESPVPIDVVYGADLVSTGQVELSQALHQLLPSFYSVKQTADDGVNMVDPISLRGLGPDQVLVLVNGKRKHKSAFLNVSDVFGKGTASTDLNTIPLLAIDRVEVLRDGASSQYGSDAIGGVINIVLKDRSFDPTVSVSAGTTTEGDGETGSVAFNYGFNVKRRGFVNLTGSFIAQAPVNRAGDYIGPIYGNALRDRSEMARSEFFAQTGFPNQTITELGSSATTNGGLMVNSAFEFTNAMDLYAVIGTNFRSGEVNAYYRLPVSDQEVVSFWHPDGFSPTLTSELVDHTIILGVKGEVKEWFVDISYNLGRNGFDMTVENSNNASMGRNTPISTFAGAFKYHHDVIGFEAARSFELPVGALDLAFGGEFRMEEYHLIDGETESYFNGGDTTSAGLPKAAGMQGYFGVQEADALEELRTNASVYLELDYEVGDLLLSGAVRFEEYSDFGQNFNYKLAGRYKIANQLLLRGSYSTGFKAPSLHQLFYQKVSTEISGPNLENVVLINTESPIFQRGLGATGLEPELSQSFSVGITSSINRNISLSVDAYQTDIDDRIGLASRINVSEDTTLQRILGDFDIQFLEFFGNFVDTRTRGIDAVLAAQYYGDALSLNFNTAFSYVETTIERDADRIPGLGRGFQFLNRNDKAILETYVPRTQWRNSLGITFKKFVLTLSHNRFGRTEFQHIASSEERWEVNSNTGRVETRDQTFSPKDIFNADLKVSLLPMLDLTIGGLNLTNQYPDEHAHSSNVGPGLYPYSPVVRPFDLRGTYVYARIDLTL
ncbi:MAG: TonB-dependent receptor [Bacteroidota bacterium]